MPNPNDVLSTTIVWRLLDERDSKNNPIELPEAAGDPTKGVNLFGQNFGGKKAIKIKKELHNDGRIYESSEVNGSWTDPVYVGTDDSTALRWRNEANPSRTTRVKGSNGNWWNYDEVTNTSVDTGIPYDTRSPEEIAAELEYKKALTASAQHSAGGPYATPDKQGELESRLLDIEKKRQALMAPAMLAFKQWQDGIDEIAKNPNLSLEERNKQVDLLRQNYEAVLQGTTPWAVSQAEQARKDRQRENQLGLAQNTINSRMSTGSNLAQGLFSGLTGAFGNILSSTNPRYNYNPFDMANSYMNQQQGGSEMSDLALALLRGALKGEQQ